jgi:hypothetical protein
MNPVRALQAEKQMVDVARIEPATPWLQSEQGKTLNSFVGVAYAENQRSSRSSNIPKLYRIEESEKMVDWKANYAISGLLQTSNPSVNSRGCETLNALFGVAYDREHLKSRPSFEQLWATH